MMLKTNKSAFLRKQSIPDSDSSSSINNNNNNNNNSNSLKSSKKIKAFKKKFSLQDDLNIDHHQQNKKINTENLILTDNSNNDQAAPMNSINESSEILPSCQEQSLQSTCGCVEHLGKEILNQVYNMPIDYAYNCLFGFNEFHMNFLASRKITDRQNGEWFLDENDVKVRKSEFCTGNIGFMAGKTIRNVENLKILRFEKNFVYVLEQDVFSYNIPYSNYFKITTRFCLTKLSNQKTRICIHAQVVFLLKTNFIIKNLVEKTSYSAISEYYEALDKLLKLEAKKCLAQSNSKNDKLFLSGSSASSSPSVSSSDLEETRSSSVSFAEENKQLINQTKPVEVELSGENDQAIIEISHDNKNMLINRAKRPNQKKSQQQKQQINLKTSTPTLSCEECENCKYLIRNSQHGFQNYHTHHEATTAPFMVNSAEKQTISSIFLKFLFLVMFVLFVFNFVLYSKLRDIEQIAVNLKVSQKFMSKLNNNHLS